MQSILSVNAKLSVRWQSIAEQSEDSSTAKLDESLQALSLDSSTLALFEAPAIHVDEAQRTIWRIAQVFYATSQPHLSLVWSKTAYDIHDILIGGGTGVFKDRWGPTNESEQATLEWLDAWNLWERKGKDAES